MATTQTITQEPSNLAPVEIAHSGLQNVVEDGHSNLNEATVNTLSGSLNVAVEEDIPPDGGYGWVVAACAFLMNAHTSGLNSSWSIFLAYYLGHSTFPGASRFLYALIGGLSISQAFIITPLINLSIKSLGTRPTMGIGSLLIFAALFSSSFATSIWHLVLSQGLCFGFGMGFLYIPASIVLPQWFSTRRSLANGIASSGSGLGGLVYTLAANAAVQKLGPAWAYRTLAFCALAANSVAAVLMKDRNRSVGSSNQAFNWKELCRFEVILVILWGGFAEIGYVTLLYSLPSYGLSIGLTQSQASIAGAVLNLGLGVGRPLIGQLSDSYGRINISSIITFICAILCFAIWVPAASYGVLILFSLAAGVCCGIFWCTAPPVLAEVVGLKRLPPAFAAVCMALVLPATFGEPMALELQGAAGYLPTKLFVGSMFVLSTISSVVLRAWKIADVQEKARMEQVRESTGRRYMVSHSWGKIMRCVVELKRV